MRWLRSWLRRRSGVGVSLVRRSPRPTAGQREAVAALHRAEQDRAELESRADEVAETAASLRETCAQNHFAERIRLAMEGGR